MGRHRPARESDKKIAVIDVVYSPAKREIASFPEEGVCTIALSPP